MSIKPKQIAFPYGCDLKSDLEIDTLTEDGKNLLIGSIFKSKNPHATYLGKMAEFDLMGNDLWLDTQAAHVVYVMGSRRSGKSYTLGAIAEGLVSKNFSIGSLENAVLIFDTLNLYWTMENPASEKDQLDVLNEWGTRGCTGF